MDISQLKINNQLYDLKDKVSRDIANASIKLCGSDPITDLENDTPKHWAGVLGSGYWWISTDGILTDKPRAYGMLVNYKYGNTEIFQIWLSMMYNDIHVRSGNGSGWSKTWERVGDDSNCLAYRGIDPIASLELDTPRYLEWLRVWFMGDYPYWQCKYSRWIQQLLYGNHYKYPNVWYYLSNVVSSYYSRSMDQKRCKYNRNYLDKYLEVSGTK